MISIVMMSYLGDYPGSRKNPVQKFNRAVQSVVEQTHQDWELIIVSDGCDITNQEYRSNWSHEPRIKLIETPKSKSKWPGTKRQIGVDVAKGEWITYLDSDDMFLPDRLSLAHSKLLKTNSEVVFDNNLSIIFDKSLITPHAPMPGFYLTPTRSLIELKTSVNLPEFGKDIYYYVYNVGKFTTGTWSILHKRDIKTKWQDSEETGEDTIFARRLINAQKCEYLPIGSYIIRHSAVRGWDI